MQNISRLLGLATLLFSGVAFAGEYFPLDNKNEWVYRNAETGERFQVRVGLPVFANDHVYFILTGYAEKQALVRINEEGDLVAFDEENRREELVTSFTVNERVHWQANRRLCDQEGQTLDRRTVHEGPAGPVRDVLQIQYRNFSCADTGVESEQFAENIGMLRRVVQTIAGPRTFDLVYARVGHSVIEALSSGRFTVSVEQNRANPNLRATLRLQTNPAAPSLPLAFPTAQEFEVLLRDSTGNVVWSWSDGQAFLQAAHNREVTTEWSVAVTIPKPVTTGGLRAEVYTVQAWLTTQGPAPQFAATAPVTITTGIEQ